jgi:L-seryl-tRNA(Ser) seleniumtransferase
LKKWNGLGGSFRLVGSRAQVGGGTLPHSSPESVAIEVQPAGITATELAHRLRTGTPPVIATVTRGCVRLDLRTVFPREDNDLNAALQAALGGPGVDAGRE